MTQWIDPRTNPAPPYRGPERPLALGEAELTGLITACKEGRLYDAEAWIASGRPLQVARDGWRRGRRNSTPLAVSMAAGNVDLVRLHLCNGYRAELEPHSPLNDALEARRWDLLGLLLDWGADPAGADLWRVLDTYERAIFDRFRAGGVDLTAHGAMACALATSSRNRPLYGFVKNYRDRDPRIQRALDVGLGAAIKERNAGAISLCLWAGADPRRRVGGIEDDAGDDDDGMTAFERAVADDTPEVLRKLGFDPAKDDLERLYQHVYRMNALRALVAIRPPSDWPAITRRFVEMQMFLLRLSLYGASITEIEEVFALGGRLEALDRYLKRDLRHFLLTLSESDAQRLFLLLRNPDNMDRDAFLDLIAHEKLAARYSEWSWRAGFDKTLLTELAAAPRVPAPVRRMARERLSPPRRVVTNTCVEEAGVQRVLSREELYELVWAEPLVSLSKRFGLSDNGLRKRCKAMNVPTPARGYWERVKSGRKVRPTPLPGRGDCD